MTETDDRVAQVARARRRAAVVLAGTGVFWILSIWLGPKLGLGPGVQVTLDLVALAGFGLGLWLTFRSGRA